MSIDETAYFELNYPEFATWHKALNNTLVTTHHNLVTPDVFLKALRIALTHTPNEQIQEHLITNQKELEDILEDADDYIDATKVLVLQTRIKLLKELIKGE